MEGTFMQLKEQIYYALEHISNLGNAAVVEAGHIYVGDPITSEHAIAARIGGKVVGALTELGMDVQTVLLVDDYNSGGSALDTIQAIHGTLGEHGFLVEKTVMESDLIDPADALIATLLESGRAKQTKKGHIVAPFGNDTIMLRVDHNGLPRYSCEILDAALYQQKAASVNHDGLLVTVLPGANALRDEQAKAKFLLQSAGCYVPVLNVYFNGKGDIELDFEY